MKKVESSTIDALHYEPEQQTLRVHFKSGGVYTYHGVSQSEYAELESAESVGSHLHNHIKPHKHVSKH